MVDDTLTRLGRALRDVLRLVMRSAPILPAALVVAIGLASGPVPAWSNSPVIIEGADDDTRDAIRELLPDRERPTTLFEAERLSEEAAERATAWLRSEGYYAATVTPEAREEPAEARVVIELGARFQFAAPSYQFANGDPGHDATTVANGALARVREGQPARAEDVLAAEAAALQALREAGFPDARAGERRVVVDHATSLVNTQYNFDPGSFARLGQVRAQPPDLFRPSFVGRLRNWDEGDPYTPERLARLRRDITATGAVSLANTELGPPDANGVRDVVLNVEPAKRNAYEFGLGYSTTEGLGLDAEWTRRNYTRRADALTVFTRLSQTTQTIETELSRPHGAGLGHTRTYGVSAINENLDAYNRLGAAIYASVDATPRLTLGQSYGVRISADTFDNVGTGVSNAYVLSAFYNVRRDTTDVRLDPRHGDILDFRIEPSVSTGDATLAFARFIGEARGYQSFGHDDRVTLAGRARVGWLEALSGDVEDTPPDRRFYAGGGGSVRGYDYNSLYPAERDVLGLTPGGQGLFEISVEARWRFTERWGAAAFADGGAAFDDWSDAGDLSWGVGVGLRYDLGFAPLRFDIAVPLDDEETGDDFALYVSLGQAF